MKLATKYELELKEVNDSIHIVTNSPDYEILAQFLDYWSCPDDIKEDLLPEIDAVLNGNLNCSDVGADVVGLAYVEVASTKLIGSDLGYGNLELPTTDFRELILEWLNILESSTGKSYTGSTS